MPGAYQGGSSCWDSRYAIQYNNTPSPGIWCGDLGSRQVQLSRQAYYASISFVDEWIGKILQVTDQQNTLVLFTADHGDMMGDHYHWRKGYPYQGSANIPMIVKWPLIMDKSRGGDITVDRGSISNAVTELRDIFPTVIDAAKIVTTGVHLNGSSLLRLLRTDKTQWREYIDMEHDVCYNVTNHWNALTDGHIKYIYQPYFNNEQLFDLDNDQPEINNLASDPKWEDGLKKWRLRMVKQFEIEGRGEQWVKDGHLVQRIKSHLYSPNYPAQK